MDIKNNPNVIHETVIRDVIELLGDLTNDSKSVIDKVTGRRGLNGYRNIARGTRDLTLTFPVIVTNATSVETASMIAKAIERKAVTMLQMLFSAVSITNADNALDYIKKFHTNLDVDGNMGVDDVIDLANQISTMESTETGFKVSDQALFDEAVENFKRFRDHFLPNAVNEHSLNDFMVNPSNGMSVIQEKVGAPIFQYNGLYVDPRGNIHVGKGANPYPLDWEYVNKLSQNYKDNLAARDKELAKMNTAALNQRINDLTSQMHQMSSVSQAEKQKWEDEKRQLKTDADRQAFLLRTQARIDTWKTERHHAKEIDDKDDKIKIYKDKAEGLAAKETRAKIMKTHMDIDKMRADMAREMVINTDIKKANELVPSMMVIQFCTVGTGETPIISTAVIGVKARLQYVLSQDMRDRIIAKNTDKNGLFNLIKATTGQISFWKDFIFAVKKAKLDALSTSGKGSSSPIWKLLERRAIMSKIRRWTGTVNDASAITTLVLSQDEADILMKEERIDVMRPATIHSIMNAYNIMCFVVVDEVMEKVHFLFDDGSNSYETMSFSHLEREEGNGAYKKVINLLTKSR